MKPFDPETYPPPAIPDQAPGRIFIFSGHMVDAPDRPQPRFPPAREAAVQHRLSGQLDGWRVGPNDLAISGAARGGDILFAEHCADRGAVVWLLLPLPLEEFLEESVRLPGTPWVERFHALRSRSNVRCFFQSDYLGEDREGLGVHARNNLWIIATARALAPSPECIVAFLVWDEKTAGDGPGGTADFGQRVRQLRGQVAPPINPLG